MVARQVLATDPSVLADLAAVRLGEAAFRRALASLPDGGDDGLDGASLLPGWTRRHVVAHVGYNARALSRLVVWAETGVETPMYASAAAREAEIELGATLRPDALRSLAEHSAVELDVRWRDLPDDRWAQRVRTSAGREVAAAATLWMRQREVWLHAVDIAGAVPGGLRLHDLPEAFLARLLADVTGAWAARGERLGGAGISVRVSDADVVVPDAGGAGGAGGAAVPEVAGRLVDLVGWATGRGGPEGLRWEGTAPLAAPRWL